MKLLLLGSLLLQLINASTLEPFRRVQGTWTYKDRQFTVTKQNEVCAGTLDAVERHQRSVTMRVELPIDSSRHLSYNIPEPHRLLQFTTANFPDLAENNMVSMTSSLQLHSNVWFGNLKVEFLRKNQVVYSNVQENPLGLVLLPREFTTAYTEEDFIDDVLIQLLPTASAHPPTLKDERNTGEKNQRMPIQALFRSVKEDSLESAPPVLEREQPLEDAYESEESLLSPQNFVKSMSQTSRKRKINSSTPSDTHTLFETRAPEEEPADESAPGPSRRRSPSPISSVWASIFPSVFRRSASPEKQVGASVQPVDNEEYLVMQRSVKSTNVIYANQFNELNYVSAVVSQILNQNWIISGPEYTYGLFHVLVQPVDTSQILVGSLGPESETYSISPPRGEPDMRAPPEKYSTHSYFIPRPGNLRRRAGPFSIKPPAYGTQAVLLHNIQAFPISLEGREKGFRLHVKWLPKQDVEIPKDLFKGKQLTTQFALVLFDETPHPNNVQHINNIKQSSLLLPWDWMIPMDVHPGTGPLRFATLIYKPSLPFLLNLGKYYDLHAWEEPIGTPFAYHK